MTGVATTADGRPYSVAVPAMMELSISRRRWALRFAVAMDFLCEV